MQIAQTDKAYMYIVDNDYTPKKILFIIMNDSDFSGLEINVSWSRGKIL